MPEVAAINIDDIDSPRIIFIRSALYYDLLTIRREKITAVKITPVS
jgi:hypothetical protein